MDEVIEMLHDFVVLTVRGAQETPLSGEERGKMIALSRMLPGDGTPPGPDDDEDCDGIPVQITAPGGFETARLMAASRDGLRLQLAHPLRAGTATVLRVIAPSIGVEYTFPCRVAWSDDTAMGLAFDGAPTRIPLARALSVGWRRQLDLRTGWGLRAVVARA